jgi:hypothetical protein
MRFWYDTEFYEDGKRIHLISFGMVAETGAEFYWENSDFDWGIVPPDHWIQKNVRPHLDPYLYGIPKDSLIFELKNFVQFKSMSNEFWGYYADYDHVVMAQLFGRMVDMPQGFPWYTLDIKQEAHRLGVWDLYDRVPQDSTEHHALNDARWNKKAWQFLKDFEEDNARSEWYG